jgi:hypothetical protein
MVGTGILVVKSQTKGIYRRSIMASPKLQELRLQWQALLEADSLDMLPKKALVASIKNLAQELLDQTVISNAI